MQWHKYSLGLGRVYLLSQNSVPGIVLGDEDKTITIAMFSALMELQASGEKMELSNSNLV